MTRTVAYTKYRTLPNEADQIAERIHKRHDLGGQAAARAPDGLTRSPPFAPVPCWCTRTMVPSTMTYSKSGSPDSAANSRSKTPLAAQRRKRRNTEFHDPYRAGRSRQGGVQQGPWPAPQARVLNGGAPTRAIHKTASRNSRLSAAERPGSPSLPGSKGATRAHIASLKAARSIVLSSKRTSTRQACLKLANVHRP